jgi:hypothetical protein
MPWWGWVIIAIIVIVPIKLMVLKKMLEKNNKEP